MATKRNYGKTARGTPITHELVDKLAREAEAGYDVGELLRRRAGAASVESVRLDPELRRALRRRADKEGWTSSE